MLTAFLFALLACNKAADQATPKTEEKPAATADKPADIPAPEDVAAPPADAQKTASGLAWKSLSPGNGTDKPTAADTVEVNYTGWTTDGKMFDSSTKRGKAAKFPLKNVIPGWTEGLQLMSKGEKARFWIPVELAYNNKPGKPAGMLVFDVELVNVIAAPKPIPAPDDVAAAPKGAKKTKSGLQYMVLTPGTGKDHPTKDDKVEVDYTGWTTDGKMFDSSVTRGKPATFPLGKVIPGWTEGVQLMVVGEKTRFWIPANLAYGDKPARPGAPSGPLTFDIELKSIKPMPAMPAKPPGGEVDGQSTRSKPGVSKPPGHP